MLNVKQTMVFMPNRMKQFNLVECVCVFVVCAKRRLASNANDATATIDSGKIEIVVVCYAQKLKTKRLIPSF